MKKLFTLIVIVATVGASYVYYQSQQKPTDTYVATDAMTGEVGTGTLDTVTIVATGDENLTITTMSVQQNMESSNQDIINTILPIVSIMVAFILSITTYLTSTSSPKLRKENLAAKVESREICALIEGNINLKKETLNQLGGAYMIVGIVLLILSGMILLESEEKIVSISLRSSLLIFTICFSYFSYKVIKILHSNLDIDMKNIQTTTKSILQSD